MTNVPPHPAEFSPEVVVVLAGLIQPGEHVHDPYGGRCLRLGALCDRRGAVCTATDIEQYVGADRRVRFGDAGDPTTYPLGEFVLATSPPYLNGISSDYKEGPTSRTKGIHFAYGISLGHALHPANLARLVVRSRPDKGASDFWPVVAGHIKHWPRRVLLNVDLPMLTDATAVLAAEGYEITQVIPVVTRRIRNGENRELRAEHEVVIEARRSTMPREPQLFDWEPPRRRQRRSIPASPRVDDDPRWRVIATVRGVDRFAHLINDERRPFAIADYTLCGLPGRALPLQDTRPMSCPKCLQLRDHPKQGTRHAR